MARIDKKKKIRASILDRLIDHDPNNNLDTDLDQHQKLQQLRNNVRRDLENLLNTRYKLVEPDKKYNELQKSLLNYGLPDLGTVNVTNPEKQKEFIQLLEFLLAEYEPRFKSVKVNYMKNTDSIDRTLRFRIDAILYADPSPEAVVFDSMLDPVTRTVNIKESSHG